VRLVSKSDYLKNKRTMNSILTDFVKNNDLNFDSTGSGLNSDCIILSGFCDYVGADLEDALAVFRGKNPNFVSIEKELRKTHKFAASKRYGKFWATEDAHKMYTFEDK